MLRLRRPETGESNRFGSARNPASFVEAARIDNQSGIEFQRTPFVLGMSPPRRTSMRVAMSSARPNALNNASTL